MSENLPRNRLSPLVHEISLRDGYRKWVIWLSAAVNDACVFEIFPLLNSLSAFYVAVRLLLFRLLFRWDSVVRQ